MKPAFQIRSQKLQIYLILALGTVPVPALLFVYFAEHLLPYTWIFPLVYVILALLSLKIPSKMRVLYGIAGLVLFLIPGFLVPDITLGTRETVLVVGVLYGIQLFLSLQIAGWPREQELPVTYAGYCLIPHLFSQFITIFDSGRQEMLDGVAPWLTAALFVFVGLVMLSMNRSSIKGVTKKRQGSFAAIRGKNTLLTLGLFGSALLTSLIPSSISTVLSAFGWVFNRILMLFDLLIVDTPVTIPPMSVPSVTTEPGITELLPTEPADPVAARTFYVILVVFAVLIVVPLAILALICVWKLLKKLGNGFWSWFQRMLSNASDENYEDEITDTREEDQIERTTQKRDNWLKIALANEQKMTAEQRIRHRYRRLAMHHKEWGLGSTARENLPDKAAELYERSRYSDHPISDEDALLFKKITKEL